MSLKEAQTSRLEALRADAADRPAHLRYINALMACADTDEDNLMDVLAPGVSERVSDAILSDVFWIRQPEPTGGGFISQYDDAYAKRRMTDRRAMSLRQHTMESREGTLESLINISVKDTSQ